MVQTIPNLQPGALAHHIRGVHNRKLPIWGNRSPPQSYLEGHTLATLWTVFLAQGNSPNIH